jgi:Zn finger protein HypA/HybF involved in hydrogenase expression
MRSLVNRLTENKAYSAGQKVGPGKYVCLDCGKELTLDKSEQDLRKCPSCSCEEYQCFPMTHIRPDIKSAEDVKNPPKRGKSNL